MMFVVLALATFMLCIALALFSMRACIIVLWLLVQKKMTRFIDWTDRNTAVLFGDGGWCDDF